MVAFICLFFPAVLSVWIFEHLAKSCLTPRKWFYLFTANTLFINLLCFLVKRFILQTAGAAMYTLYTDMTPSTACNYLIMAIPFAVIVAIAERFCKKFVKITVEDASDDDAKD